ncbi:MAG TPA: hypothetical protein VFV99_22760 [Kofleriaceae bacterium]|nr:hypothetical protein [Kofleriaceae bacterium]
MTKKEDADALLKKLIGDKLQIAIGDVGVLEISATRVAADLIDAKQDFERVVSNVYGYRLKLGGNDKPGDGNDKVVEPAKSNFVTNIKFNGSPATEVQVDLKEQEGPFGKDAFLVFEGLDPIKGKTTPNAKDAKFPLDPTLVLKSGEFYRMLFIKDDVPVSAAFLKAP